MNRAAERIVCLIWSCVILNSFASAQIDFEFNQDGILPSALGAIYSPGSHNIPETQAFAVSGGLLQQDTRFVSAISFESAQYNVPQSVVPLVSVVDTVLEWRIQVIDGGDPTGLIVIGMSNACTTWQFRLSNTALIVSQSPDPDVLIPLDTTSGLHTYRVELAATVGTFRVIVDNALVFNGLHGMHGCTAGLNWGFGSGVSGGGSAANWDYIRLSTSSLSAPSNLLAKQLSSYSGLPVNGDKIELRWSYGPDPVDGFKVSRMTPLGSVIEMVIAPQSAFCIYPVGCSYVDTVPSPFATYSYSVRAFQGANDSASSNVARCFQLRLGSASDIVIDAAHLDTVLPLVPGRTSSNPEIVAGFTPDQSTTLDQVLSKFSYDHFNWVQYILHDNNPEANTAGVTLTVPPPQLDPPIGGYQGRCVVDGVDVGPSIADGLPFYLDEPSSAGCFQGIFDMTAGGPQHASVTVLASATALFQDRPFEPSLAPSDYIGFVTTLVGVTTPLGTLPTKYDTLKSFLWYTTYNGSIGGGVGARSNIAPPTTPGTGGIFNVQLVDTQDLPVDVRSQLIQEGAQGITTDPKIDKDAPMTAIFTSGQRGANGWYTSPVQVTLIATDVDGPSDVASTSYSVDGTSAATYASPFTVAGDAHHQISFSSVDISANQESPPNVAIINIDSTPPAFNCLPPAADGAWHATNLAFNCLAQDNLSGLDSSSHSAFVLATTVPSGTETAGALTNSQRLCDLAGNCATATIAQNMIDLKPPTINAATPINSATYGANQSVNAVYGCIDLGSGVATCTGTVPSGTKIDTIPNGISTPKTFVINATDGVGNSASQSINYLVSCHYVTLGANPSTAARGSWITVTGAVTSCTQGAQMLSERFTLTGPLGASCSKISTVMFTTPQFTLPAGTSKTVSFPFVIPKSACSGTYTITSTTLFGGTSVDTTSALLTIQ